MKVTEYSSEQKIEYSIILKQSRVDSRIHSSELYICLIRIYLLLSIYKKRLLFGPVSCLPVTELELRWY